MAYLFAAAAYLAVVGLIGAVIAFGAKDEVVEQE